MQGDIDPISTPVVFHCRARGAGNGPAPVKRHNTAAGLHRGATRVGLSSPLDGIADPAQGWVRRREPRLAENAGTPAEGINIALKGYRA